MMGGFAWTDERVQMLKNLWEQGLSASEVAAAMGGVTRGAVIGKVHRLNLAPRDRKIQVRKPAYVPRPRKEPRLQIHTPRQAPPRDNKSAQQRMTEAAELAAFFAAETGPAHGGVSFFNLKSNHCRWPLGDPSDLETFCFCGEQKGGDGPYCPHHHRMSLPAYLREAAE